MLLFFTILPQETIRRKGIFFRLWGRETLFTEHAETIFKPPSSVTPHDRDIRTAIPRYFALFLTFLDEHLDNFPSTFRVLLFHVRGSYVIFFHILRLLTDGILVQQVRALRGEDTFGQSLAAVRHTHAGLSHLAIIKRHYLRLPNQRPIATHNALPIDRFHPQTHRRRKKIPLFRAGSRWNVLLTLTYSASF
jgi:hypothetical protein